MVKLKFFDLFAFRLHLKFTWRRLEREIKNEITSPSDKLFFYKLLQSGS